MAKTKTILISGAGIAGPALAYFLNRVGHKCTVVERAPALRTTGQQVDVCGEGLKILKYLQIEEEVKAASVEDKGMKFVRINGKTLAAFGVDLVGDSGPVREVEIMRPDLSRILYEKTKDNVEYIFGDYIRAIEQRGDSAKVTFANSTQDRAFDIVVAADGLKSSTRNIVFGPMSTSYVNLGQVGGLCSIPWQESDGKWSRWLSATGGRAVVLRPDFGKKRTSAYMCITSKESHEITTLSPEDQRKEIVRRFKDVGWETERVTKHVEATGGRDFYVQEVAQIKTASWVKGNVVLLGDAGYCPSPFSGQGTTLAFEGAYVLAGCIATFEDTSQALAQYETDLRPFVTESQKLMPGVPWIVNPQTAWGIFVLNTVLWIIGRAIDSGLIPLLIRILSPLKGSGEGRKLPHYPSLRLEG